MQVKLLHHTPIEVADLAISKCWGTECYTGEKLIARIDRVANKHKHGSTIEHLTYNFDIDGISRACLQELARHRISSYSVKSSRYTLGELKKEKSFNTKITQDWHRAKNYLVFTGDQMVDGVSIHALEGLRILIGVVSNDIAKYCMPESYKTSLVMSINARSLQNFLSLRTDKSALWEIRNLAKEMFNKLPKDHKFLFEEYVCEK